MIFYLQVIGLLLCICPNLAAQPNLEVKRGKDSCEFLVFDGQIWAARALEWDQITGKDKIIKAQEDSLWIAANENKRPAYCIAPDSITQLFNGYAMPYIYENINDSSLRVATQYDFERLWGFERDSLRNYEDYVRGGVLLFSSDSCSFYRKGFQYYRDTTGHYKMGEIKSVDYWSISEYIESYDPMFKRDAPILIQVVLNGCCARLIDEDINPNIGYPVRLIKKSSN